VTGDERFQNITAMLHESGTLFSVVGRLFRIAETDRREGQHRQQKPRKHRENPAGAFELFEEIVS
jgi:hypothetical protein